MLLPLPTHARSIIPNGSHMKVTSTATTTTPLMVQQFGGHFVQPIYHHPKVIPVQPACHCSHQSEAKETRRGVISTNQKTGRCGEVLYPPITSREQTAVCNNHRSSPDHNITRDRTAIIQSRKKIAAIFYHTKISTETPGKEIKSTPTVLLSQVIVIN